MSEPIDTREVKIEFKNEQVSAREYYNAIKWILQKSDKEGDLRAEVSKMVFNLIARDCLECRSEAKGFQFLAFSEDDKNLNLEGLFLEDVVFGLAPAVMCGVAKGEKQICGKPASVGQAYLMGDGRWSVLPVCRECAEKINEGYLKGEGYDRQEEINGTR